MRSGSPAGAERKVILAWDGLIDTATSGYIVYAFEKNTTLSVRVDVYGGDTDAEIDGLK